MYIRYTSLWRSCGSFKIWNSLRHSIGRRTRSKINVKFKTNVHRLLAITFSSVPARRCISRVSTVWYYMVISYLVMAHLANHGIRILWWTDAFLIRWSFGGFVRKDRATFLRNERLGCLDLVFLLAAVRFLRIIRLRTRDSGAESAWREEVKKKSTHLPSCFLVVTTSPAITWDIAICRFINPSIREAYELREKRITS